MSATQQNHGVTDVGGLAYMVGIVTKERVLERVHAAGFPDLLHSHLVQLELIATSPRTARELGEAQGVTRQHVAKLRVLLAACR